MANEANKKKGGLGGGGLKSLFEKNGVQPTAGKPKTADGEIIESLQLSTLVPNPFQPRYQFDDDALQQLADSIAQNGVVNPIVVRKKGAKFEIVAGERRYRASKLAQQTTIPAIVREMDDEAVMEVAIIENLQRENLDAIEEAKAYKLLMDKLALTQTQVAKRIGKDRSAIANTIRLLNLPEDVQALVQDGQLSMGQARALLGLKKRSAISALAQQVLRENLTVRQVEELVQRLNEPAEAPTPSKKTHSPFAKALSSQLEEKFGTKVQVNTTEKGTGKIEINYVDQDDLARILTILDVTID
jgi:ParB family chromosome partitioning protein